MLSREMFNQLTLGRKAALVAFDAFAAICVACALLPAFAQPAYAYVDPSVMTYTIQALAGVAVALSTVLGVAFRRTRKKLLEAMGIDENHGKEVDTVWHRIDEDGNVIFNEADVLAAPAAETGGKAAGKGASEKGDRPGWRRRFVLSLLAVGFAGFTLGIVAPFEIVAGGAGSLTFSLTDVAPIMAVFVAVAVLVLALALSCVRGKAFTVLLSLVFAVGLCCYVQAMFMNSGLPSANGSTVDFWGEHATMMVISAVVWVALIIAVPVVSNLRRSRAQAVIGLACAALIVVQGVGVASLFMNGGDNESDGGLGPLYVTAEGLYEVSSNNNVIVFILDCFDTTVMNQILAEDSSVSQGLEDFTYYDNQSGTMIPTKYAVPNLLTGSVPQRGQSFADYEASRYRNGAFLQDISDAGYSIGLYSDTLMISDMGRSDAYRNVARYTENIHSLDSFAVDVAGTLKALIKCALYRDAPWALKWRFWFYTDEVNQSVVKASDDPAESVYSVDDVKYYADLQSNKLSLADDSSSSKGAFKFIHLAGDHNPYNIDENGNYVGLNGSSETRQAKGSLTMVKTYLQYLRDLGKYDDATIIITSDHGHWESSLEQPTETVSPMLLVKKSGATGGAGLQVSHSAVSHADFQGTVLSAMGISDSKYPTTYFDDFAASRPRDFYMTTDDDHFAVDIFRYQIEDMVTDMSNWKLTDDTWHVRDVG
jgi:hypothetical protein